MMYEEETYHLHFLIGMVDRAERTQDPDLLLGAPRRAALAREILERRYGPLPEEAS